MAPFVINREPRRRFGTIAVLSSAHLFLWIVQGALPTVFPSLARRKGLTTAQYSSVFGFFGLTRLLCGCFDNELLSLARPKFYVVNGLFLLGGITILHGVLKWSPAGDQFYLLSFLIQSLGGIAVAFLFNASLLVLDLAFPTHALYYVTVLETFSVAGLLSSPIFSLISLTENYSTPFLLFGFIILVVSISGQLSLQDERPAFEWCSSEDGRDLFRIHLVKAAQLLSFFNTLADTFLLIILSQHATQINISGNGQISALYLLYYACYASAYFIVKSLTKSTVSRPGILKHAEMLWSSLGCLTSAFGFLLLGPSGFLGTQPTAALLSFGLILRGLGCGCLASSTFIAVLRAARKRLRLPYDTQTNALVNRMLSLPGSAGYACGAFLCCALGSKLHSMESVASIFLIGFLVMCIFCWACHLTSWRQRSLSLSAEETPLCDCSLRVGADVRTPIPVSPTDLMPSDEDWQWLIQKRDDDDNHDNMQPSL